MLFPTPGWSLRLWPHDKSNHMTNPQMALLLIPCVRQNGQYRSPLGVIPVETTVATTVKFRPLFANLKQFSQTWPSAYGLEYMCVCIHTTSRPADTNHKSVYLRIYTSTYTRTVEVGWSVRRMANHDRVQSERAGLEDSIRHVQFYNYNRRRSEILSKVIKCQPFTIQSKFCAWVLCSVSDVVGLLVSAISYVRCIFANSRKIHRFWKFAAKIR